MSISSNEIRAAAQAVAAIAEGWGIRSVSRLGIELGDSDGWSLRGAVLAEIAVGMAGIAAVDRWRFGTPPHDGGGVTVHFDFNDGQLEDLKMVRELIEEIDPAVDEDTLHTAWQMAQTLVSCPQVWASIEWLAGLLGDRDLDAADVSRALAV